MKPSDPKYVLLLNGRVVYRPYIKKSELHKGIQVVSSGKLPLPIDLGRNGDDPDKTYQTYLGAKEQLGVKHFLGKQNRPFTTTGSLNAVFGIKQPSYGYRNVPENNNEIIL